MMLCRLSALLIAFVIWCTPAGAEPAKVMKASPTQPSAYRNKPIVLGAAVWFCAYNGRTQISCRLGDGGDSAKRPLQVANSRLPRLVRDIINTPEDFVEAGILIPLHTYPVDFELVGDLAESVMCGNQEFCGVIFAETAQALGKLVSAFENMRLALQPTRADERGNKTADNDGHTTQASGEFDRRRVGYQLASASQ